MQLTWDTENIIYIFITWHSCAVVYLRVSFLFITRQFPCLNCWNNQNDLDFYHVYVYFATLGYTLFIFMHLCTVLQKEQWMPRHEQNSRVFTKRLFSAETQKKTRWLLRAISLCFLRLKQTFPVIFLWWMMDGWWILDS